MSFYLKSTESKFDFTLSTQEIDMSIKNNNIKNLLKDFPSIEQIQYILFKHPYIFTEDCLIKLLKHKDIYISLKSFSLLTTYYQNHEHKKEYIVFFRYMLLEDLTYEEKNQLISLFINFISAKSNLNFDIENRKNLIISDINFLNIIDKMINIKELQYNILVMLYVFSFTDLYTEKICKFLKKIIFILKNRSREKILRICSNVLLNILKTDYNFTINQIYELRKIITTLCKLNISDESLLINLKICKEILDKKHSEYSIEQYITDLFKGILEDHDYHYDEVFWNTGLPIISKNLVELVKILKKYLKSHNTEWICLACNDIFMLINCCPGIISILNKYKVRDCIFDLTKSENDAIRFKAIQALYASIFSEWN